MWNHTEESIKPTQNFICENPVLFYYHALEDPKMILEAETLNSGKEKKEDRTHICSMPHATRGTKPFYVILFKAPQVSTQQNYCCDGNQ